MSAPIDVRELLDTECPHKGSKTIEATGCEMCLSAWADALEARVRAEVWEEAAEWCEERRIAAQDAGRMNGSSRMGLARDHFRIRAAAARTK